MLHYLPQIKNKFGKTLRVVCVPKNLLEDTLYHSADGLEQKTIDKDLLSKLPSWLSYRQYLLLRLRYYEDWTFKRIGRLLGITEARASQIHREALVRAREKAVWTAARSTHYST